MRLFLRPYHVFPILSHFSLSYLCSCWLGYLSHHPRLFFFSTQRERKLNGSSLIVALVSLFSFLKATKWIAFHSSRSDVSTVSIISQLLYGSSRLHSARPRFRDWSVSRNHIADPRSYNIQRQYAIFQAWCFKVFLPPIVFVLFETILFWSFCVHLQKRIQTFEDCI